MSVSIEKPICDFLLVIKLTDILSRTASKLSQITVQMLGVFEPLWGRTYGERTLFILGSLESS